jgi:hypothetical protein
VKLIPLTQGQSVIVDDNRYEELSQFKWHAAYHKNPRGFYAMRKIRLPDGRRTTEKMHRRILGLQRGDKRQGDHRNHNTLDNRKRNLRIATSRQNKANQRRGNSKSGLKGVSWDKSRQRFIAMIGCGKQVYLGRFADPLEAHFAYLMAAVALFGRFACPGTYGEPTHP